MKKSVSRESESSPRRTRVTLSQRNKFIAPISHGHKPQNPKNSSNLLAAMDNLTDKNSHQFTLEDHEKSFPVESSLDYHFKHPHPSNP